MTDDITNVVHKSARKTARDAAGKRFRKPERVSRSHLIHIGMWVGVLGLIGWFLHAVSVILLPFIIGGIMAYLFDPVTDKLEKRIGRTNATIIITFSFFAGLLAILSWLGPLLYEQLSQLIANVPELMREMDSLVREKSQPAFTALNGITHGESDALPSNAGEIIQRAFSLGGEMLLGVLASSGALLNVLSLLLITPVVAFYLLRDWDRALARLNTLLPLAYAPTIRALARDINRTLSGYLRGQLYVMLLLAGYHVIGLTLAGLNYSLIIGVLAGVLIIIPYLGVFIAALIGMIVAYSQYEFGTQFWVIGAVFVIGQTIESQILTPKIIGDRVGLHPLWMLFGMLAGGVLLGFVGVLLAVPITAVISVLVKFVIGLYLDSSLYTEK